MYTTNKQSSATVDQQLIFPAIYFFFFFLCHLMCKVQEIWFVRLRTARIIGDKEWWSMILPQDELKLLAESLMDKYWVHCFLLTMSMTWMME